ncbi:MAG: hypothetical protein ABSD02_05995 [Steroidobacteraceae bacterium]
MKVTPSNQTLILASERGMSGGLPVPGLRHATTETALRRVTIVASRPGDSLVYVQADYASTAESSDHTERSSTASAAVALPTLIAMPARMSPPSPRGNPYSSSRGVELYSSTQRMLSDTPVTRIDVHA